MRDFPISADHHADLAEAAQHALRAKFGIELVEMAHAIQQRQDAGGGADGRANRFDRAVQVVGLATEDDQIEWLRRDRRGEFVSRQQFGCDVETALTGLVIRSPFARSSCARAGRTRNVMSAPAAAQRPPK